MPFGTPFDCHSAPYSRTQPRDMLANMMQASQQSKPFPKPRGVRPSLEAPVPAAAATPPAAAIPTAAPILAAMAILASTAVLAATPTLAGDLTINISGIAPSGGQIYVAVYDRPEAFPTSGQQRTGQVLEANGPHVVVHFKDLPPGAYAAVAFQDVNGNGKLDKNFLGIPKEPFGFSNGARGSAGPPKFSAAAVTLNPDCTTTITLK
jgi:uncharacterized protein (DUF2141 family)